MKSTFCAEQEQGDIRRRARRTVPLLDLPEATVSVPIKTARHPLTGSHGLAQLHLLQFTIGVTLDQAHAKIVPNENQIRIGEAGGQDLWFVAGTFVEHGKYLG